MLTYIMVEFDVLPDDFLLRLFPRNLSYTEESYLDSFSTCSTFVKVPNNKRQCVINFVHSRLHQSELEQLIDSHPDSFLTRTKLSRNMDVDGTSVDDCEYNSPKGKLSEIGSEEGVFVNSMDDLDSVDSHAIGSPESRGSDISYFSLDSIASPEEDNVMKHIDQKCLTKAVTMELQKSELRKSVTEPSSDSEPVLTDTIENGLPKTDSNSSLETKLAKLKVEIDGEDQTSEENVRRFLLTATKIPVDEEPEFDINRSKLRKSSSLKTNKTPPGTPGCKKMVRFADAMGLDLESIRHVMDADNPPRIPASAIKDLKVGVEIARPEIGTRFLDLLFPQPCTNTNFMGKVMANKVALENCVITDMSITGVVRVANIGFHKCVRVRYSVNNWVTFYDVMASYVQNSYDGATDRFSFTIVSPANVGPGSKVSFAISYTVNDQVYWDSNDSKNYEILCFAKTTPTELEASWMHFV